MAPPPEPSRPPIQEILPADVQQQFRASVQRHRSEIAALLARAEHRRLNSEERNLRTSINQFVKLSTDAEKNGDWRSADQLAERAHVLAKALQNGK